MRRSPVIVIGAGIGGLTAAIALAAQGLEVRVVEAAPQAGGKLRPVQLDGHWLDTGPTVFTMRWVFDKLFVDAGTRMEDHMTLLPAQTLARHAWSPTEQLDLYADVSRSADAIGQFAGAREADGYLAFCQRARTIYQTLEQPFLRGSRSNPLSLAWRVGWRGLPGLARISPFASMWQALGDYFRDPRLRQLFGRYATYCGSSPFMAPATLMLVAHVEQDGVWLLDGGMHRLADALERLAISLGVQFQYDASVQQVLTHQGRASGVRLADGQVLEAAAVVFNGDVAALGAGLLGDAACGAVTAPKPARRSLSAVTWAVRAPTSGFGLLRHNVFFSADYAAEFSDLFTHRRPPAQPTVYVCAQDRGDSDSLEATGAERLLCLVNAPAIGDQAQADDPALWQRCEDAAFARLAACGLQIERDGAPVLRRTPADFDRLFPATGGALYGQASHGWLASFTRPGGRSRLPGLYLAGGSTHPGPGVPMAALSGRQAAASLLADCGTSSKRGRLGAAGAAAEPAVSSRQSAP